MSDHRVIREILTNKNKPELKRCELFEVAFKLSCFQLAPWPMVSAAIAFELVPVTKKESVRVFSKIVLWPLSLLSNGHSCVGTSKYGRGQYGNFDRVSVKHYNNLWLSNSTSSLKTGGIS
jgi:hypothetical protein